MARRGAASQSRSKFHFVGASLPAPTRVDFVLYGMIMKQMRLGMGSKLLIMR